MNARIKKIRLDAGLSQDKFAAKLGYKTRGKIANIELGRTTPDDAFLYLVCRTFSVNRDWIDTGNGDMYQTNTGDAEMATLVGKIFISALSKLSVDEWEVVAKMAQALVDGKNEES